MSGRRQPTPVTRLPRPGVPVAPVTRRPVGLHRHKARAAPELGSRYRQGLRAARRAGRDSSIDGRQSASVRPVTMSEERN